MKAWLAGVVVAGAIVGASCGSSEPAASVDPMAPAHRAARVDLDASLAPAVNTAEFDGSPQEAARFIEYYNTIQLTPEQERIKEDALTSIPAPCCSDFSIATCCCPCNLAKSVWGLAHHLIANEQYDAGTVGKTVRDWLEASNPAGFSGDACFTGGCERAFADNGCGGMDERHILSDAG